MAETDTGPLRAQLQELAEKYQQSELGRISDRVDAMSKSMEDGFRRLEASIREGFAHRDAAIKGLEDRVANLETSLNETREQFIDYRTKVKFMVAILTAGGSGIGAMLTKLLGG